MRIVIASSLRLVVVSAFIACAPSPPSSPPPAPPPDPGAGGAATSAGSRAKKPNERVHSQSPRAIVLRFLKLAEKERYDLAANYLDLEGQPPGVGPEKARRLKIIIDREAVIEPELLSPQAEGDVKDGLPETAEEIATVKIWSWSRPDKIRLVRRDMPKGPRWRFSKGTVGMIDGWYNELPDRWILEHLPAPLLKVGWRGFQWWQWIAFPIWFAFSLVVGFLLARLTRASLGHLVARRWPELGVSIFRKATGPLVMGWAIVGLYLSMPWLGLYERYEVLPERILRSAFFLAFFWSLFRSIDVIGQMIISSTWGRGHLTLRTMIPLGARVGKVAVIALTVVAVLSSLGYPVASLIAGLGIGGLTFALAAQKTVENLFGAFSIGVDQPFRLGDLVKVDDITGHVEALGLRSTRIRTSDRTLVTMPNGRLAESRVESFSARDRTRLRCVVTLPRGTKIEKARQVLEQVAAVLRAHPQIWKDGFIVQPKELNANQIELEVTAWFVVEDSHEYQEVRQGVLFKLMEVMEEAGGGLIAQP